VILDNARNLKWELKAELLAGILPAAADLPARDWPAAGLALGLTGTNHQYRIAVRTHDRSAITQELVQRIRIRVRGECEVKFVGRIRPQASWHRERNRPLRVGGSLGHVQITAGTLGCFVRRARARANDAWILSNNHVLANENRGKKGDIILQPAASDGGVAEEDRVSVLGDYVKLAKAGNEVDAGLAMIDEGIEYYYNWLHQLGAIQGVRGSLLEIGERVAKVGRTTGLTRGRISAIEVDGLKVGYDMGDLVFDNQIEVEPVGTHPFSLGGDSGSLIVDSKNHGIGLLFAGNDVDVTYANPLTTVLDALDVKLLF
jgi:hypothetical protein